MIGNLIVPNKSLRTDSKDKLRTWAGNIQYSMDKLESADSLAPVREFVQKHEKLMVLGTRHCFNTIADSKDQFLSLNEMYRVVFLNKAARTVTVAGRMTYGQLCRYLDSQGFALQNEVLALLEAAIASPKRRRRDCSLCWRRGGESWVRVGMSLVFSIKFESELSPLS